MKKIKVRKTRVQALSRFNELEINTSDDSGMSSASKLEKLMLQYDRNRSKIFRVRKLIDKESDITIIKDLKEELNMLQFQSRLLKHKIEKYRDNL